MLVDVGVWVKVCEDVGVFDRVNVKVAEGVEEAVSVVVGEGGTGVSVWLGVDE